MLKKINTQVILAGYLIINVLYLLLSSFLWRHNKIYFIDYSRGFIFLLIIDFILIIGLILRKKYKKNIIDIFLVLCIIFGVISTIFAYNMEIAIFGEYNRYEGLLQICYYITILFISSFINDKYKKYIINTILFTGIIQFLYGFLQVIPFYEFIPVVGKGITLARGMITNSNFYGTYMLICLSYSLGLFLDSKDKNKKIVYFVLYNVFIVGLLIANALSSIVGFICILICLLIYSIIKKIYKKFILVTLSFIILFIGVTEAELTFAISDLIKTKDEVIEISKGNFDDHFGTDRMYVWKETLKIVPNHLINGVGIDNYAYAFDGKALTMYNGAILYDKAHNEYLQTLVTQGIFSLISYLSLFIIIVIRGIKNSLKTNELYLILPVIGYLVQAFFNISVIEVAPLFYISLGLLVKRDIVEN